MIWHKTFTLEEINTYFDRNMTKHLGIKASAIHDNELHATMPITEKVLQPFGILHGGASVVLAESVGSIASAMIIDTDLYNAVGLEINANHLRPGKSGIVTAQCTPIHIGRTTHIWDIKISDERHRLLCVSRLTVAIVKK